LITFGGRAEMIQEPTEDVERLSAALSGTELQSGTELYDGAIKAIEAMPDEATRNILVVLGDGQDTRSSASLEDVIAAAQEANVDIYTVGIAGNVFIPEPLEQMANATGGHFQKVSSTTELAGLFDSLGRELLHSNWLEYHSAQPGATDVKLTLDFGNGTVFPHSFTTPALKGADGPLTIQGPSKAKSSKALVKLPDNQLGIVLAALPFALLIAFLVYGKLGAMGRPNLAARVDPYTKQIATGTGKEKKSALSSIAPAMRLTESLLGGSGLFRHYRFLLEQANIPLRASELLGMNFAGLLIGAFFGYIMLGGGKKAIFFTILFALTPYLWVKYKARKRRKMFEDQLADVLSTVASSLKAGHSFNQSISAVIKETPNPTSEELQRAMT
jgi:tight adherence protein B